MKYLLPLLLISSQLMIFPQLSFRWCKEVTAQVLMVAGICYFIWQKNKSIALFVLWSLFTFFLFRGLLVNDVAVPSKYILNGVMMLNMINIVLYGMFYAVLRNIKLDKNVIYKTFCFIAIFQSLYVIFQVLQLDQFFHNISLADGDNPVRVCWPVGLWGNESLVSWCIAICAPFFLQFKQFRYKLGYALSGLAIVLTGCSAGLLAYGCGLLFFLFFRSRKLAVTLIILFALIGGGLTFSGKTGEYLNPTHRFEVWKTAIDIGKTKGLTGWGHGSFATTFYPQAPIEIQRDGWWRQAHNEFVQVFYEQGVIGLGILLSLMWIAFMTFIKKRKGLIPFTSLVAASCCMFFGFPLRTAMGALIVVSLVLFEKENQ